MGFLNKHIVSKIIHTPIVDKEEVGRAWLRLHQGLLSRLPGRGEEDKTLRQSRALMFIYFQVSTLKNRFKKVNHLHVEY